MGHGATNYGVNGGKIVEKMIKWVGAGGKELLKAGKGDLFYLFFLFLKKKF